MTPYADGIVTGLFIAATVYFTASYVRRPRTTGALLDETRGQKCVRFGKVLLYLALLTRPVMRRLVSHGVFFISSDVMWGVEILILFASAALGSYGFSLRRHELAEPRAH